MEASRTAAAEPKPATATPTVPAPTATPTPAITQQPTLQVAPELAGLLADMGPKVAAWRGLEPWDVPASLMTPEEFKVWLAAEFEEEYPADEVAADQLEWELLGLIRPEQSLYELQLALYGEQVAGFYDSEAEEIVLIGGHDAAAPMLVVTLAHEYVHALQDRAFDLDAIEDSVEDNQDALLALRALVEGDATLAGLQYAERALRQADFARPPPAEPPPRRRVGPGATGLAGDPDLSLRGRSGLRGGAASRRLAGSRCRLRQIAGVNRAGAASGEIRRERGAAGSRPAIDDRPTAAGLERGAARRLW